MNTYWSHCKKWNTDYCSGFCGGCSIMSDEKFKIIKKGNIYVLMIKERYAFRNFTWKGYFLGKRIIVKKWKNKREAIRDFKANREYYDEMFYLRRK